MKVKIKYLGIVDISIPSLTELEEGSRVQAVIDMLGDMKQEVENATFLVNKEPADIMTVLQDGDTLLILQVLGGG